MKKRGFTLIELLIVVAIIAILAAIAVPNFLEAQVRSKVSRAKADVRSIATALESYAVDTNGYPPMGDRNPAQQWAPLAPEPIFHSRISSYLTTPIAYITGLYMDPFMVIVDNPAQLTYPYIYKRYTYYNYDQWLAVSPTSTWFKRCRNQLAGVWLIYSWGPDKAGNWAGSPPEGEDGVYTNYDPTNGTISIGNIIRTQNTTDKFKIQ